MWHNINEGPPNSWNQYIPNQGSKVVLIIGRDLRCRKSRPPRPQVVLVFPPLISDTNLRWCSSHLAVFCLVQTQLTWWSNHFESTFSHQSKPIVISPCDYIFHQSNPAFFVLRLTFSSIKSPTFLGFNWTFVKTYSHIWDFYGFLTIKKPSKNPYVPYFGAWFTSSYSSYDFGYRFNARVLTRGRAMAASRPLRDRFATAAALRDLGRRGGAAGAEVAGGAESWASWERDGVVKNLLIWGYNNYSLVI